MDPGYGLSFIYRDASFNAHGAILPIRRIKCQRCCFLKVAVFYAGPVKLRARIMFIISKMETIISVDPSANSADAAPWPALLHPQDTAWQEP